MFDTFIHKYLKVPYQLNVHFDQRPKNPKATLVLLHGLGESASAWDEIVKALPDNLRVVSVDLLGFGSSPKPKKMKYNVDVQAKSVIATLLTLNIRQRLIVVGHSMGSLTAIEITKRYPIIIKGMILCSPPLYDKEQSFNYLPEKNKILKSFYKQAIKNPDTFLGAANFATKMKFLNKSFSLTKDNIDVYMASLESSIIHQTSLEDIKRQKKPTRILYGIFDPLIVKRNLNIIIKANKNIKLVSMMTGHELSKAFVPHIIKAIAELES